MRRGTGLKSTHVMVVRLVRLLIETGGLTGKCNWFFQNMDVKLTLTKSNHGPITPMSVFLPQRNFCDSRTCHVENIRHHYACYPE